MIEDLAKYIGKNISASLSAMHLPSTVHPQSPTVQSSSHSDLSRLMIAVQSDTTIFFSEPHLASGVTILMHILFMNGRA